LPQACPNFRPVVSGDAHPSRHGFVAVSDLVKGQCPTHQVSLP
jgi:hypothetical protein